MAEAGLQAIAQHTHHGLAPFLLSEGIAAEPVAPPPHFRIPAASPSGQPIP
jgi:hypothetical protein